jgi:hypothetical protein
VIDLNEERTRIIAGMLALTSFRGRKPFHAIWLRERGFLVQVEALGPTRMIDWAQADRVIELGRVDWIDIETARGRKKSKNPQPADPPPLRRAEYLAAKNEERRDDCRFTW